MKEQIQAVSRVFWATVVAAVVVIAIGVPIGDNANTMAALEELEAFRAGFPRAKLEHDLLAHASMQGMVQPADAAAMVKGEGLPKLTVGEGAKPIEPRATLDLGTLASVDALRAPGATLEIASPDGALIGGALGWRLSRAGAASYELSSLELTGGGSSAEAVALENSVGKLRTGLIAAEAELAQKTAAHDAAVELWEARRKWKAPWKSISRANEKRLDAKKAMDAATSARDASRADYEKTARNAESFKAGPPGDGAHGVVIARLAEKPSGKLLELQIPTQLVRRSVPVPHLEFLGFPIAKQLGLWDAIKDGSAEDGIAMLMGRFSWHYAHVEVSGFKLGGMTVLQLAPLLVLIFMGQITRRARGLGASYNPFDRPSVIELPRVGLGSGFLNATALIGLPLVGCGLCAWSLIQIAHVPVVPVLSALAVVGIGGFAQSALGELLELRDAITRSHSNPPPAPAGD